jgi:SP family arabinose:H+ symporter-like MFS transporter
MKSRVAEALNTLRKIGAPDPEIELQQMLDAIHVDTLAQKEPLFQKRYFMPIPVAIHIAVFNQCWGINAVLYYLNDIFVSAGFSRLSGNLQAVAVGCQLDLHTRSNGADRSSRPQNAAADSLCGHDGRARYDCLCLSCGHARRALLAFVAAYIAFFAISSGAVAWVYVSEIFPTNVRMKG